MTASASPSALVALDRDGTRVGSVPDLHRSVSETLRQRGRPERHADQVRGWVGNDRRCPATVRH